MFVCGSACVCVWGGVNCLTVEARMCEKQNSFYEVENLSSKSKWRTKRPQNTGTKVEAICLCMTTTLNENGFCVKKMFYLT